MQNNEIIKLIFAFKVKYFRQQKEYSYQSLSDITGLSVSYLNDIERGKKYPKFDKINALAEAFGVSYDYLVSTKAPKKVEPVIELFTSDFLNLMTSESFDLDPFNLLNLLTIAPERMNALISALFNITKTYQMRSEHLYFTALRSYQALFNNYFGDVEQAVVEFVKEHKLSDKLPRDGKALEKLYVDKVGFKIDRKKLAKDEKFKGVRSYFSQKSKTLYIQDNLSEAQVNFIIARELGFWHLGYKKRPKAFPLIESEDFDTILYNFKASYFAVALLMPETEIANELFELGQAANWKPKAWENLLTKFNVTPEMLLQRLTNILPKHFDVDNLFFLRIKELDQYPNKYAITKQMHLGRNHHPYANVMNESYCRRWVSINCLKEQEKGMVQCQISDYHNTDHKYFCISILGSGISPDKVSVTLGILMNDRSRALFRFLGDPNIQTRVVHTTCQRCSIVDCKERESEPKVIMDELAKKELLNNLKKI